MRFARAVYATLLAALVALPAVTPAQPASDERPRSPYGLRIENGPNQGTDHTDTLGVKFNYRYITTTFTNDSTVPIRLQLALSDELECPASWGGDRFRVFLLPRELTPDTASLNNNITEGLGEFLDRCLDRPYALDRTLQPGEQCVTTIGTLYLPTGCLIAPNVLFGPGESGRYAACDSLLRKFDSTDSRPALSLKLDIYVAFLRSPTACIVLPCGRISYPEP